MKGPFHLMTFAEKLAHIKKCQAEGLEEIRKGSPSNLADIADHLDLWGPWMHKQLAVMRVALEAIAKPSPAGEITGIDVFAKTVTVGVYQEVYCEKSGIAREALATYRAGDKE